MKKSLIALTVGAVVGFVAGKFYGEITSLSDIDSLNDDILAEMDKEDPVDFKDEK